MPSTASRAVAGSVLLMNCALLFDRVIYMPADPWARLAAFLYFGTVPEALLAVGAIAYLLFGRGNWRFRALLISAACALALVNLVLLQQDALPELINAYYYPCGTWLSPALLWYWGARRRPRTEARAGEPAGR